MYIFLRAIIHDALNHPAEVCETACAHMAFFFFFLPADSFYIIHFIDKLIPNLFDL